MLPLHQWLVFSANDVLEANSDVAEPSASVSYESLFAVSAEPVVILDAADGSVIEANPRALKLFDAAGDLVGSRFLAHFDQSSSATILGCLALAQATGRADMVLVHTLHGRTELSARFSLVLAPPEAYFIVRLRNAGRGAERENPNTSAVFEAIDNGSVGFLITDSAFHIDYANRAFVEMVGLKSQTDMRGSPLARWLKLSAQNLSHLQAQMSRRQAVALLTTHLCLDRKSTRRVEVCAVAVPDNQNMCWGFSIRELPLLN